ncbi:MAG TPA: sll0787 family AIR synthase-like protein [Burkholderiaceae bacterium]
MNLQRLCEGLRASRGFAHKRDIAEVMGTLTRSLPAMAQSTVRVGDDCAAIPLDDGSGHLLFAMEGFVEDFVERMPWFAGYCGVMVNVSDIAAMGGRPLAVVDALWSAGAEAGRPIVEGLAAASERYGVPIVGGHSNHRSERSQLAVAIVGRAKRLLTSFDACAGDALVAAIDLRGAWQEPWPYWNASTEAPAERLRGDLELLPQLAEQGLCRAAKDISMAGALGTLLMLLECSGVGARVSIDRIPRPVAIPPGDDGALLRWLTAFPSYGFVLSVDPGAVDDVLERFTVRGIAAAEIGCIAPGSRLVLEHDGASALLWDHAIDPFICAPRTATVGEAAHA